MIFTLLLTGLLVPVTWVLAQLPTIPAIPSAISGGAGWVLTQIVNANSVAQYIFTPALWSAALGVVVAIFVAEYGYYTVMWIATKIPFLDINR